MILYSLDNYTLIKEINSVGELEIHKKYVGIFSIDELEFVADKLNINEKILYECYNGRSSKFVSYEGFDYISIKIPDVNEVLNPSKRLSIYFTNNIICFICDEIPALEEVVRKIEAKEIKCSSLGKMLYLFFDYLTINDTYSIENIELEIARLEEGLITSKKDNYLNKIIILRKKLLKLKRYYERFLNIAEMIEENENSLIDEKTVKYFKIFTNRIERLYQSINNLRDYVTQVREAYQAQVDINQNNLMRLFTVVTTIFMPLTLIVGWYGMNFNMPEYSWSHSYSVVIGVSILVVVLCVLWFKKNKWF